MQGALIVADIDLESAMVVPSSASPIPSPIQACEFAGTATEILRNGSIRISPPAGDRYRTLFPCRLDPLVSPLIGLEFSGSALLHLAAQSSIGVSAFLMRLLAQLPVVPCQTPVQ